MILLNTYLLNYPFPGAGRPKFNELEKRIPSINGFVSCNMKNIWQHCQPASKAADKDIATEERFSFPSVQWQQVCKRIIHISQTSITNSV